MARETEKFIELNSNLTVTKDDKGFLISVKDYYENSVSDNDSSISQLYSSVIGIGDFIENGKISYQRTHQIEKQIISFINLFSNSILNSVDYALEIGINHETVKTNKDKSKRLEKQVDAEIKERLKQETDFDAISYLKIRAQEIGLNKSRVESLISKAKWRGYR